MNSTRVGTGRWKMAGGAILCVVAIAGCGQLGKLLGGGGGGGLGGLLGGNSPLNALAEALKPPSTPLDGEFNAPQTPVADGRFISDQPFPIPINGASLGLLETEPSHAAVGPDGQIYFTERHTGRVRQVDPNVGAVVPTELLDLAVNNSGSRGLIGISFSTDGTRVFLTYNSSTTNGDSSTEAECFDARLVSFAFSSGKITGPETILYSTQPRDPNLPSDLSGIGPCVVAPDGFLYLGHGDRNNRLTVLNGDNTNPSGKILRFNQDGTVPAANPTAGSPIFATGFRNPTGFAVDSQSFLFWVAEQSSSVSDELNALEVNGFYGWPLFQGSLNTDFETGVGTILLAVNRNPIIDFGRSKFDPMGIVTVRNGAYGEKVEGDVIIGQGSAVPAVIHRYKITADFVLPHSIMWTAPASAGRVRELVQGKNGLIYVFCQGELFVLNPA